jgi:hypothetical protein
MVHSVRLRLLLLLLQRSLCRPETHEHQASAALERVKGGRSTHHGTIHASQSRRTSHATTPPDSRSSQTRRHSGTAAQSNRPTEEQRTGEQSNGATEEQKRCSRCLHQQLSIRAVRYAVHVGASAPHLGPGHNNNNNSRPASVRIQAKHTHLITLSQMGQNRHTRQTKGLAARLNCL